MAGGGWGAMLDSPGIGEGGIAASDAGTRRIWGAFNPDLTASEYPGKPGGGHSDLA